MMEDSTSYHGGHTIAGVDPGLVVANLQRLRARDAEVSPPRGKVALVLQGGAMRGVFGAGA